jgi:hypothetical protein
MHFPSRLAAASIALSLAASASAFSVGGALPQMGAPARAGVALMAARVPLMAGNWCARRSPAAHQHPAPARARRRRRRSPAAARSPLTRAAAGVLAGR